MIKHIVLLLVCAALAFDAAAQADPKKVLRVSLRTAETGFDPQAFSDLYSGYIVRAIFEPPFRYDYRARPHKVVPNTAVALPEGSKDGREWTIRIKPGIYFADDPAFKGKKRELTAADYAYSWKRIVDPRMRSPALELFDGKIVGMDKLVADAKETGKFDYDAPVEGLVVTDKYTLKLKLNIPWWDILPDLTSANAAAVAREVVEAYSDGNGWVMANPVGTGPYRLKEWVRAQKIVLEANPTFRGIPYVESSDPADREVNARFRGKTFPLIGRVEVYVLEESQPRVLAFEKADIDYLDIPTDLVPNIMERDGRVLPRFAAAGVRNERGVQPSIVYAYFNMEDPVIGGYTKEKIALRRAIGMGYNAEEEIRVIRQGQGQFANMVIPPGVAGYDAKLIANTKYDPEGAKALLDKFGYIDRDKDGWRDMPDGTPLVLKRGTSPSTLERQYDELWARNMKDIGIRMEMVSQKWPDMLKMARNGKIQIWQLANTATSTEGYGVLGLLYGPNAGLANLSRFKLPEFDRLYDESKKLPDGPDRAKLVGEMSKLVAGYAPWKLTAYRIENITVYPWVVGLKYNPFNQNPWQYLDIDLSVPRKIGPMKRALVVLVAAIALAAHAQPAKRGDPAKVLRTAIMITETGFDPQIAQDLYSNTIVSAVFDPLYEYDYLARPHRIVPRVADGMPEISADGLTWTIRVRKGIFFADDPAFKGQKRELTAHDFAYAWKRLADPRVRSPNLSIVRGRIVGVDKAIEESKAAGRLDYERDIEGLRVLDRYTLQLRFVDPDYSFLSSLTASQMSAVAREVIEAYGDASGWVMANPVGTGPFKLKEWRRGQRIVLEANPDYREESFPSLPADADAESRAAYALMKGKRLPQVGRVEIAVIEESNPRLLGFNSNELDLVDVPRDLVPRVLDEKNRLLPAYAKQGVTLQRAQEAGLAFFAYFNMNDAVVGGYTPEKVALRRAILMGYDPADLIRVGLQGQGAVANQLIPPEIPGHVAGAKNSTPHDPALARALLDKFGYKDRDGDGFRERPDGKPLVLSMGSAPTGENRIRDELWLKNMRDIGIRIEFVHQKWPDLVKMARAGQLQMWQVGWAATSAGPFMELAYGPSAGETNLSFFRNDEYDDLFRRARSTRSDAERAKLYARMTDIVAAYAPMGGGVYRIENTIAKPWVLGYRKDSFRNQPWRFVDIDVARMKAGL